MGGGDQIEVFRQDLEEAAPEGRGVQAGRADVLPLRVTAIAGHAKFRSWRPFPPETVRHFSFIRAYI